jgi:hypothetical protein
MVGMNLRAPGTTTSSRFDTKGQVAQGSSQPTTNKPDEALDNNPLGYNTLSYPSDITNNMENGHYMLFYVNVQNKTKYAYRDPEGVAVGDVIETAIQQESYDGKGIERTAYLLDTGANAGEIAYQKGQITQGKTGNILSSDRAILTPNVPTGFQAEFKTTSRITDSVALYLPANVSDNTGASYEGMETGIAGLIAAGGGAFVRNMRNNDYEAAASSLISGTTAIAGETVKRLFGEVGAIATGTDEETIRGLAAKAFGTAENPFIEMLFKQMNLREFSYEFTFSPRNQKEAEEVQAIIKLFRFHMAPELMGNNKRYLRLPSTFDIHYMYQHSLERGHENNFYSKIATCVLSGVNVDYTPGGVKSFQDGSPTQITMGLSFQETELLTKDMINKGY